MVVNLLAQGNRPFLVMKKMKIISLIYLMLFNVSVYATPQIQSWQTENGARVLFVPATEIPMLDVRIVFDAGSARDAGISGLALLTNGLL